jgi:hypothetical protein
MIKDLLAVYTRQKVYNMQRLIVYLFIIAITMCCTLVYKAQSYTLSDHAVVQINGQNAVAAKITNGLKKDIDILVERSDQGKVELVIITNNKVSRLNLAVLNDINIDEYARFDNTIAKKRLNT